MTFTLRRKRPTTVPASLTTTAPTGIDGAARTALLVLGGLLLGGFAARAQDFSPPPMPAQKSEIKAPAAFDPVKKGLPVKPLRDATTVTPGSQRSESRP